MSSVDEAPIGNYDCRVYWGAAGCELPRGHGPSPLPVHRDGGNEVTAETAVLFGEDLTDDERKTIEETW